MGFCQHRPAHRFEGSCMSGRRPQREKIVESSRARRCVYRLTTFSGWVIRDVPLFLPRPEPSNFPPYSQSSHGFKFLRFDLQRPIINTCGRRPLASTAAQFGCICETNEQWSDIRSSAAADSPILGLFRRPPTGRSYHQASTTSNRVASLNL